MTRGTSTAGRAGSIKLALAFLAGCGVTAVTMVQVVPPGALQAASRSSGADQAFDPGAGAAVVDQSGLGGSGPAAAAGPVSGTRARPGGPSGSGRGPAGVGGSGPAGPTGAGPGAAPGPGAAQPGTKGAQGTLECAPGRNGGSTDTGVSGGEIKLAATVVEDGVGRAFLGDVEFGMNAVVNKVNRTGGICGRRLSLKLVNDSWNASDGQQAIRRFISEGYFALAVVPSSEGLRLASNSGDIDRAGIPVVGADGMLVSQYTDPWIWSGAASTISTMHIMAKDAYDRGARTFGLVYDQNYRFGVEGAAAFRGALSRLPGTQLKADVGIQAGQQDYSSDINNRFNNKCGDCDFVAMLLEPQTAEVWIEKGGYLGTSGKALGVGGPQTLFGHNFAQNFAAKCPQPCANVRFWVWTGFKPPVAPYDTDPAVQAYVTDMQATNSSADRVNQFVEAGYDGMLMLAEALKRVGPNLTRAALRQTLDALEFDSGLSTVRRFQPGNHYANTQMQAFSIVVNSGQFTGFRQETTWRQDLWVGQDAPSE